MRARVGCIMLITYFVLVDSAGGRRLVYEELIFIWLVIPGYTTGWSGRRILAGVTVVRLLYCCWFQGNCIRLSRASVRSRYADWERNWCVSRSVDSKVQCRPINHSQQQIQVQNNSTQCSNNKSVLRTYRHRSTHMAYCELCNQPTTKLRHKMASQQQPHTHDPTSNSGDQHSAESPQLLWLPSFAMWRCVVWQTDWWTGTFIFRDGFRPPIDVMCKCVTLPRHNFTNSEALMSYADSGPETEMKVK